MVTMLSYPYLIQRLQQVSKNRGPAALNPNAFSFGGGLKNGGLSDEAMSLFRELFRFDYMGAAEFEFGAIPKTFEHMAAKASTHELKFHTLRNVAANNKYTDYKTNPPTVTNIKTNSTIYLLCTDGILPITEEFIRAKALKEHGGSETKERVGLCSTLARIPAEYDNELVAWLDIDNHTFFTHDKNIAEHMAAIFNIKI